MAKFQVFIDPQHAWVKVPRQLINSLGIADEISTCSFQRTDKVYLEEDCDFGKFYKAMEEAGKSVEVKLNHSDRSSRLRNYERYQVKW